MIREFHSDFACDSLAVSDYRRSTHYEIYETLKNGIVADLFACIAGSNGIPARR